ncbi:MAG TPA: hypothetical protein VFI91_11720 [Longimicrobiaceae bacterium]|nr:hypothetical protein [Longimicrobiaceae bacterium]
MAKKKKKRSSQDLHRQVQDAVQALPYAVEDHKKNGRRVKAFMLRYLSGPMLRLMNKGLGAKRYRGKEGVKLRQTDQMRRHLEQRGAALKHVQDLTRKAQKKKGRGV